MFAVIAVLGFAIALPFMPYIVLAGILTYTLFPIYQFLSQRTGKPGLSAGLAIILALLVMILPTVYLVSELVDQVSGAYTTLKTDSLKQVGDYFSSLTNGQVDFQEILDAALDQVRQSIVGVAPNILGSISELLLGLFIMFFVMFYGFREGQGFITYLKELLPLETGLKDSLFHQMRTVTQAVLYGQVLTAVIQGALGGLGLLVCGVPNALFWGAIMMITAFLPLLGTPLIWVPAGVGLIMDGSMTRGILLLIYGATIVMNIDNFLRPRLVSGRSNVHPVLILIGVLGGLRVFGFVGMLVGPLVMAILVALIKFYEQNYMRRKQPQSVL
ncbi:MAG TPA: AI-2E family transporter [Terriglobia bacterium]|nr:AI-2E family transporter [Terriglobia bacterium]